MPNVLLAFDDVGMAVQLQEELEGAGYRVRWDAARSHGPALDAPVDADVVLITAGTSDRGLEDAVRAWHDADPPPALLIIGSCEAEREAAARAQVSYTSSSDSTAALSDAIQQAIKVRFAGGLSSSSPLKVALRALGQATAGDEQDLHVRLIAGARKADVDTVREALRWYARAYTAVDPDFVARMREHRALTIPEVEFTAFLDGTITLQAVLKVGKLEPWQAARFVWALASAGALTFSEEPPDQSTSRRRRITQTRYHLRARAARLERATYYDVLEVTVEAQAKHVERATQMLALRYHPERLERLDLSEVAPLVRPTWDKILEARTVLLDPTARARYGEWLAQQRNLRTEWSEPRINAQSAAQMMARGQQSLVDGKPFQAVSDMASACRLHPQHPDYEASLAWARFRADSSKNSDDRAAIATRERAIAEQSLAGHRPWPRALLALGLLCVAEGDADAARWHLHEALACDPNLPAAKQLLQRIG